MKFTSATILALAATTTNTLAFAPVAFTARRNSSFSSSPSSLSSLCSTTSSEQSEIKSTTTSKKEDRLRMMKSEQFHRRGFKNVREKVEQDMGSQFQSEIVQDLKSNNYVVDRDGVKVYLAKDSGFCWGVERSIALAYEAAEFFPDRKIHITNVLIHNPEVNDKLKSMNIQFLEKVGEGQKNFATVNDGDVVILPGHGASYEEMDFLDKKNVDIVDTTCPWVSKVWNTVDMHQKKGLTSVIHGKYGHEETVATVSFCEDYICVKNMAEAEMVADYILNGGDKEAFLEHFSKAISRCFDPDVHLQKIGLANQTTMYKKETRAIGQLFQKTLMKKYGPVDAKDHYLEFDTICDATQERQDAIHELVEKSDEHGLDFILVVGGWDSSNTAHLLEIPIHAGIRSFHIDKSDRIGADNTITHRTVDGEIVTETFLDLSKEKVVMGVTSGASTPDAAVQNSLSNVFMLKKLRDAEAVLN